MTYSCGGYCDSDGDGVINLKDADSDNDGLLDGEENWNGNGVLDTDPTTGKLIETNATNNDTDGGCSNEDASK